MSVENAAAELVGEIREKIGSLEREITRLRTALEVIQGLPGTNGASPAVDHSQMVPETSTDLKSRLHAASNIAEAAQVILDRAKKPMRAREIAEHLLRHGFPYDKSVDTLRATIAGVLDREIRDPAEGKKVHKPRRGYYALTKWEGGNGFL